MPRAFRFLENVCVYESTSLHFHSGNRAGMRSAGLHNHPRDRFYLWHPMAKAPCYPLI
jgi:hypothetical protein